MIKVLSNECHNVAVFKKLSTSFIDSKITFVRGLNQDSQTLDKTGNGAGKSLLFSTLPNLAYFSAPLAFNRRKTKTEMLKKGSSICYSIANGEDEYKVVQTSSKYEIFKNGQDLEIKKIPTAEKYIRNHIFPQLEVEFFTYTYVTTQRPFPFQTDSNIDRLDHLSQIFRLESYDILHRHFATLLKTVKSDETRISVLKQKQFQLSDVVEDLEKKFERNKLATLKSQHQVFTSKTHKLLKNEQELESQVRAITSLLQIERDLDKLRSDYAYKKPPKEIRIWLKEQQSILRKIEKYDDALDQYKKSVSSLTKRLESTTKPKESLDELNNELQTCHDNLEQLETEISELEAAKEEYTKHKLKIEKALAALDTSIDTTGSRFEAEEALALCRTQVKLRHLLKAGHEQCPTCQSDINLKEIKVIVSKAETQIEHLEAIIEAYDANEILQALKKEQPVFDKKMNKQLASALLQKESTQSEAKLLVKKIDQHEKYEQVQSQLELIEKPTRPNVKAECDLTQEEIDEQIDLCDSILVKLSAKNKLVETSDLSDFKSIEQAKQVLNDLNSDLQDVQKEIKKLQKLSNKLNEEIDVQSALATNISTYRKELTIINKEIDEIQPLIEQRTVLEALVKAYSTKGLKHVRCNEICKLIEQNMNLYRPLVFAEPFEFSLEASEKGLEILVDRKNGQISDVRNLSGAESNSYRALFVISLLPLIPDSRRTNIIILDEPNSHQDYPSRQLFLNQYLPALSEIVPHVFVITPNPDDTVDGAAEWLVKKENGISELIR